MLIEAAILPVWPNFSLQIVSDLTFDTGCVYHLKGANGSGKSSFIYQVLLPAIQKQESIYTLYFEQQMHRQILTAKAYTRVFKPHREISNEKDTVDFLLEDLHSNVKRENRPCFIVMDESLCEHQIIDFLQKHIPSYCLIFSSHSITILVTHSIIFEPVTNILSKVYVSAD